MTNYILERREGYALICNIDNRIKRLSLSYATIHVRESPRNAKIELLAPAACSEWKRAHAVWAMYRTHSAIKTNPTTSATYASEFVAFEIFNHDYWFILSKCMGSCTRPFRTINSIIFLHSLRSRNAIMQTRFAAFNIFNIVVRKC